MGDSGSDLVFQAPNASADDSRSRRGGRQRPSDGDLEGLGRIIIGGCQRPETEHEKPKAAMGGLQHESDLAGGLKRGVLWFATGF